MKLQCSKERWLAVVTEEAQKAQVRLDVVLSRTQVRKYLIVRWRAWRRLLDAGCSSVQIGKASGFNHTTVLHACSKGMREKRRNRYRRDRKLGKRGVYKVKDAIVFEAVHASSLRFPYTDNALNELPRNVSEAA